MRVLYVHDFYKHPGGEEESFAAESALLSERGHRVLRYTATNEDVAAMSKMALVKATLWNSTHYRALRELFRNERPDVVHAHNTFPLISPSLYFAANAENIPVIQTVHNYRPFCLNGVLFRNGRICQGCIGHYPLGGVIHKCYRNSFGASLAVLSLYVVHFELLRTYQRLVSVFIASTQFAKGLLARIGLPEDKITVKANAIRIASSSNGVDCSNQEGQGPVFVGRFDARKGLWTLLQAIERANAPLTLIGDGDLLPEIERWLRQRPNLRVQITGWLKRGELLERLKRASMLIMPSEFYESFGNVIAEAFACGVPVVTTNIGAQSELVEDGQTGFLFLPGDYCHLAEIIKTVSSDPELRRRLGENARAEFQAKYSAERNYEMLMEIYQRVLGARG